jgi:hypothetical protein
MCRGERGLATPTLVPREDEEESAYNEHFKNEQEKVRERACALALKNQFKKHIILDAVRCTRMNIFRFSFRPPDKETKNSRNIRIF